MCRSGQLMRGASISPSLLISVRIISSHLVGVRLPLRYDSAVSYRGRAPAVGGVVPGPRVRSARGHPQFFVGGTSPGGRDHSRTLAGARQVCHFVQSTPGDPSEIALFSYEISSSISSLYPLHIIVKNLSVQVHPRRIFYTS